MLETHALSVDYGGVHAPREVSVNVPEKSVVAIIGANGAGKSTLLKTIAGLVRQSKGTVRLGGDDISRLKPHEWLDRGIVLCPEGRRLFPELTVTRTSAWAPTASAIARALISRPRILMLDEPTLGLAPKLIHEVARLVRTINHEGVTVVVVEQNAKLALKISDYAYVLETGSVALEGSSADLLSSDSVQHAYLGGAIVEQVAENRPG